MRQAADGVTADDPDFKDTVPYLTSVSDGLKQECLVSELSSSTVQRGGGGGGGCKLALQWMLVHHTYRICDAFILINYSTNARVRLRCSVRTVPATVCDGFRLSLMCYQNIISVVKL